MIRTVPSRLGAILAVSLFASLASLTAGSAATVNVTYQGSTAFGSPNYSRYVEITSPGYSGGTFAGPFRLNGTGGLGRFIAFCIDLSKYMTSGGTYTTASSSGYGAAVDTRIDKLFTAFYGSISNRVQGAAFQLALWEIITDTGNGTSLGSGAFRVKWAGYSRDVILQANAYLRGLSSAGTGGYRLTFLNSGTSQNLVTVSVVPLPAAAGMLGSALAGLVVLRRRRRKRPA